MMFALTASEDACQPSNLCQTSLSSGPRRRNGTVRPGHRAFFRFGASFGLGLCLTVATATAATGPAAQTSALFLANAADPVIVPPAPAAIDLAAIAPLPTLPAPISAEPPAATQPAPAPDPLAALRAPEPAHTGDVRGRIIASMAITDPPAFEGGEGVEDGEEAEQTLMTFDEMRVPRWIVDSVLLASEQTGVDPVYMMALADKESSFIPANRASTSSAQGLYQFITGTWLEVVRAFGPKYGLDAEAEAIRVSDGHLGVADDAMREHILGLRRNPYLSALMAAEMKKRDRTRIESQLGRAISRSEFYLSHFFGVDSARKFMALLDEKPKQSASQVFPAAARANRALFFEKAGRKTRQLSVAEVYGKIDEMIDKRLDRYEDVTSLAVADVNL